MAGEILVLKLVVTPALIAGATLAGRRWGHAVSGWLVGLPLTSAPVALFLALEQGTGFAAVSALGSLAGAVAEVAFSVAYAALAGRRSWPSALAAGSAAFVVVAGALERTAPGLSAVSVLVVVALVVGLRAVPARAPAAAVSPPPGWDLGARMAVATAVVLAITEGAPALGPRLSGILATFPVYAATLAVFVHRVDPSSAVAVVRGLMSGLFAFAAFFVVLALAIERAGTAPAFGAAVAASLAVQAISFAAVVRGRMAPLRSP